MEGQSDIISVERDNELVINKKWGSGNRLVQIITLSISFIAFVCIVWHLCRQKIPGSLSDINRDDLIFAALSVLCICLIYSSLADLLNTSTIRAGKNELTLTHRPLPLLDNKRIPSSELSGICRKDTTSHHEGVTYRHYEVRAVLKNGKNIRFIVCRYQNDAISIVKEIESFYSFKGRS
ncbi:MAG: hypothetical protein AB2L14_03970 [Candidatus Xenobiia bacterium LiM19]